MRYVELLIVMLAALTPLFLLANEVDGDEFAKAFTGIVGGSLVAGIIALYKIWCRSEGSNR